MRADARVHVLVRELREAELLEDGAAGLGAEAAQWQQLVVRAEAEAAFEPPVALDHEIVVEILGVHVRRPESVVVRRNRAETGEEEVRPREEERERVRGPADVRGGHERVVARARLEVVEHDAEVLGDHLAHPVGHGGGHVDAVDAAVLDALGAGRPGDSDAAGLEVEHRLALARAHEHLGPRAGGEAHLQAARGVAGGEERLRPRRVVAVDEDLLRPVDGHRLGVRRERPHAELELGALLDGALGERARGGDLAADEERQRVRRGVAEHGHRGLELPEAVCHSRRGVGGDQERVVDAVRDVRLDRRRPSRAHLLHRLEDLDGGEKSQRRRDLGGRHARGQPCDLGARHGGIDDHPCELDRVERHRLLGDGHVEPVARDELVDQVELLLRLPVELDHAPLLDPKARLGVEGARERDQAEHRVLGHEIVAADRPRGVERRPGGGFVLDAHGRRLDPGRVDREHGRRWRCYEESLALRARLRFSAVQDRPEQQFLPASVT